MKILKNLSLLVMLLFAMTAFTSCSETENKTEEYPNWQNTNEAYFNSLYSTTKAKIASGDTNWKIIKSWSLPADNDKFTSNSTDYIIVEVLENGTGSGSLLSTNAVLVHYSGKLLPSTSYSSGFIFDQSYYGEFNEKTARPTALTVSSLVDGFSTALQNMHIGDRWRVYIPYQLGYGESSTVSAVPNYSTLVFDLTLVAYGRSSADFPVNY